MKCYAMQRPKHRLSTEDKKKLRGVVNEYLALSTVVGSEKALEIMEEIREKESEVQGE